MSFQANSKTIIEDIIKQLKSPVLTNVHVDVDPVIDERNSSGFVKLTFTISSDTFQIATEHVFGKNAEQEPLIFGIENKVNTDKIPRSTKRRIDQDIDRLIDIASPELLGAYQHFYK